MPTDAVAGINPEHSRALENFRGVERPLDQRVPSSIYVQSTATPQYMVKMDDLVKSCVQKFEGAIQLYHFDFEVSRFTNPNTAHQQYSSGRVQFDNPLLIIPNGIHTPNIMNRLITGILIKEIKISRLQNIDETNVEAEAITFTNCYYQNVTPKYDSLIITFRFVEYMHLTTYYEQDGTAKGNNVVSYNMSTGEHKVQGG